VSASATGPEETSGAWKPVVDALRADYGNKTEKSTTILATLQASGEATSEDRYRGGQFRDSLAKVHPVSEWGCFQGGCFFRILTSPDIPVERDLLEARSASDLNRLSVVVHEEESQLIIVVNKPPRKSS
jgi:hypothetical protein